jgi:hypothetical protein
MTSPPLLDYPRLFALGVAVIPLVSSYLSVRTLRWRATLHDRPTETPQTRLFAVVFGLHVFVMLGSSGILAAINGLPSTANLAVILAVLMTIYVPLLVLGIGVLDWFLRFRDGPAEEELPSRLPLREVGVTFAGSNLAMYPLLGLLFIVLS